MKLDPKKAFAVDFAAASGWLNHYHYKHGQYHDGTLLHATKEIADKCREDYFFACQLFEERTGRTTYFYMPTAQLGSVEMPTMAQRSDPDNAFYDDCWFHYATFEIA